MLASLFSALAINKVGCRYHLMPLLLPFYADGHIAGGIIHTASCMPPKPHTICHCIYIPCHLDPQADIMQVMLSSHCGMLVCRYCLPRLELKTCEHLMLQSSCGGQQVTPDRVLHLCKVKTRQWQQESTHVESLHTPSDP